MGDINGMGQVSTGSVAIQFHEKTRDFIVTIVRTGLPNGTIYYLNWDQTWALMKVCGYCFSDPKDLKENYPPSHLWANTGFHFLAPLPGNKDLFWISHHPTSSYVPTKIMRAIYQDLRSTLGKYAQSPVSSPQEKLARVYRFPH